jgi:hypothetical protein
LHEANIHGIEFSIHGIEFSIHDMLSCQCSKVLDFGALQILDFEIGVA